jgi:hypothetical protein
MTAPAESQRNNKRWAQLPTPPPVKGGALAELHRRGCGETETLDVLTSPADSGPPRRPDATLAEIALIAFHDRTITSPNHPLIDEMQCGLPPANNFIPQPAA